jgi:hypothetical protein
MDGGNGAYNYLIWDDTTIKTIDKILGSQQLK